MGQAQISLAENFLRYFEVACAVDSGLKKQVYGIRYNVYCKEFGYEPIDAFPNGLESDEFDAQSQHALIIHKATGTPAGCVRMVSPGAAVANGLLPFEQYCAESLDQEFIDSLNLDRDRVCEISRLAVDGAFRRRPGEKSTRFGEAEGLDCTQQERRTFSMIAVASFLAATALTELSGRDQVFAMMEPFLPRLMQRSGIEFERAGQDIDYHGLRAPYFTRTGSVIEKMLPDLKELYTEISQRMSAGFS